MAKKKETKIEEVTEEVTEVVERPKKVKPIESKKDDWVVKNWAYDYIEKDIRNIESLFSYSPEYKMINRDFWEIKRASWK